MSLHQQILSDVTKALKEQDAARLSVLRMLKAALLNEVKSTQRTSDTLNDEEVIVVLSREAKKRKESVEAFQNAGREELAQKEKEELVVLSSYLPAQATDDDIRAVVDVAIAEKGKENFGAVMGAAMQQLKGKADGARVKVIVQEQLSHS